MEIAGLYKKGTVISFEVFPPKADYPVETVYETLDGLSGMRPAFISVTYGAGGGNRKRTLEICETLKNKYSVTPLMHLTCAGSSKEDINEITGDMRRAGIKNVMALRGDVPKGMDEKEAYISYRYAVDLISHITALGDFCIGSAAYPEGHPESSTLETDIENLKRKQDAGASFMVTQLFFDNDIYYDFMDRASKKGITIPISAGVMPILDAQQILRMVSLCGCSIPSTVSKLLVRYAKNPVDFERAGLDHAIAQIEGLIKYKAPGVHIYSMNKYLQTQQIVKRCGLL